MPDAPLPTVSVVIPTHGRRERLPRLLDALAAEAAHEIVVAVNGRDDGSMELLEARAAEDPRLRPFYSSLARKTAALQAGVERTGGEVVLLLDDDVVPQPGLVAGHARRHAGAAGLLVVGYMPVPPEMRRRRGRYPRDLYRRSYERACAEYERDPAAILQGLWGGNFSLRRDDALQVGFESTGWSPDSHWYHEDRDFGLRCAAAGIEAVFDRDLRARHEHWATPETFLRVARESGHTRWTIHRVHEQAIGSLPDDFYVRGTPVPGRLLVRLARRRWAHPLAMALLRATTALAGTLHFFRLESHAGYLMGTIEQQRGALDAAAATPPHGWTSA